MLHELIWLPQGNFLTWHRYFTWAYENALRKECGYEGYQPVSRHLFHKQRKKRRMDIDRILVLELAVIPG